MAISLYPHNQQAYDAACAMLEETGKACVIHPTGTGKSFIAFKYCEDNPGKKILWLSPSEYIFRTQLENLCKAIDHCQREPDAHEPSDICHCEPVTDVTGVAIRSPLSPTTRSKSFRAGDPSSLNSKLLTLNS